MQSSSSLNNYSQKITVYKRVRDQFISSWNSSLLSRFETKKKEIFNNFKVFHMKLQIVHDIMEIHNESIKNTQQQIVLTTAAAVEGRMI